MRHAARLLLLFTAVALVGCPPPTDGNDNGTAGSGSPGIFTFVDADGDLVCDTPTDPAKQIDPDTLVFAYTPLEDPATYEELFRGFIDHLSKQTGKEIRFFIVNDNAAQLEAMRSGNLHVTGFNTGSVPLAVNKCGFVPFCLMSAADGSYGYAMEIIVPASSDIRELKDLKGRKFAFTSRTSNSGFKVPSVLLREAGIEPDTDLKVEYSGRHETSILGVAHEDYDAAAVANDVLHRMVVEGGVPENSYRTIYRSEQYPTTGFGYAYNLKPELQQKIRDAFFGYQWDPQMQQAFAANNWTKFLPITYKQHWALPRKIDAALGVTYR